MNGMNNYAWEEESRGHNCHMFSPSFNSSSSVTLKNTLIIIAVNKLFKELQSTLIKSIFPIH